MGWGANQKPPNQKQKFSDALPEFGRLGLFALVAVLIAAVVQVVTGMDPLSPLYWASLGFWAIAMLALAWGYGSGRYLGRAYRHRQRWRHATPWLVLIVAGVAMAWAAGEVLNQLLAPVGSVLFGPVALVFGVVAGVVAFRSQGTARTL